MVEIRYVRDLEEVEIDRKIPFFYKFGKLRLSIQEGTRPKNERDPYSKVEGIGVYHVEIFCGVREDTDTYCQAYSLTDTTKDYDKILEDFNRIKEQLESGARIVITGYEEAKVETLEGKAETP